MAQFIDSVPLSGIIRIRDMMYSVKDPFRLDQGDVSFDAPDTVSPKSIPVTLDGSRLSVTLPPKSVTVIGVRP